MNSSLDYKGAIICVAVLAVEFILLAIFLPKFDKKARAMCDSIVEVKYLGTVPRKVRDTEGAGLGMLLYGPLTTMIATSMHPKTEFYHRFSVHYDNGEMRTIVCPRDSLMYDELMSRVSCSD